MPTSSITLATGPINAADTITIEFVQPDSMLTVVRIVWPDRPTIVQPARFNAVAAEVMRVLAAAVTQAQPVEGSAVRLGPRLGTIVLNYSLQDSSPASDRTSQSTQGAGATIT